MNVKECRFCKHCDAYRTNDIGKVRCKRFSTYVNLFDHCDYFITDGMLKILEALNNV